MSHCDCGARVSPDFVRAFFLGSMGMETVSSCLECANRNSFAGGVAR